MSTIAVKKVKLGDNADLSKNFVIEVPAVADGTLTIKRENGTNVLSIDAAGKAVIPGVVGTVAQVGGVPTGQVVERGSNANGEYVRFADGAQICTMRIAVTDQAINAAYSSLFQGTRTWIFPATFSTTDGLSVTCGTFKWGSSAAWSGTSAVSTATEAILRGWDTVSRATGTTTDISATAVGRWF